MTRDELIEQAARILHDEWEDHELLWDERTSNVHAYHRRAIRALDDAGLLRRRPRLFRRFTREDR